MKHHITFYQIDRYKDGFHVSEVYHIPQLMIVGICGYFLGIFGYLWAYLVQGGWLTGYMRDKVAVWGGEGTYTPTDIIESRSGTTAHQVELATTAELSVPELQSTLEEKRQVENRLPKRLNR